MTIINPPIQDAVAVLGGLALALQIQMAGDLTPGMSPLIVEGTRMYSLMLMAHRLH